MIDAVTARWRDSLSDSVIEQLPFAIDRRRLSTLDREQIVALYNLPDRCVSVRDLLKTGLIPSNAQAERSAVGLTVYKVTLAQLDEMKASSNRSVATFASTAAAFVAGRPHRSTVHVFRFGPLMRGLVDGEYAWRDCSEAVDGDGTPGCAWTWVQQIGELVGTQLLVSMDALYGEAWVRAIVSALSRKRGNADGQSLTVFMFAATMSNPLCANVSATIPRTVQLDRGVASTDTAAILHAFNARVQECSAGIVMPQELGVIGSQPVTERHIQRWKEVRSPSCSGLLYVGVAVIDIPSWLSKPFFVGRCVCRLWRVVCTDFTGHCRRRKPSTIVNNQD